MIDFLKFSSKRSVPVLLQTEAAECGLACLAMVASYHGHEIDLQSTRRLVSVSLRGTSLKQIMYVANKLKFSPRAVKVELEEVAQLKLPAILHWNLNHFVVLKSVRNNKLRIIDPAFGERDYTLTEASNCFTGIALELYPLKTFEKKIETQRISLIDFAKRIEGLKFSLIQMLVLSIALQVFALAAPYYMQLIVDNAIINNDRDLIYVLGIGFLLLSVIGVAVDVIRSWVTLYISTVFNYQLVAGLFRHMLTLPYRWFESRHIGDVVSRFSSLEAIQSAVSTTLIAAILDGIMGILTLIMLFVYAPMLALIAVGAVLVYLIYRLLFFRALRNATEKSIAFSAKENSHFIESVRAILPIKMFNRTSERIAVWQRFLAKKMNAETESSKLSISYGGVDSLSSAVENILIVGVGAMMVLDNEFSIGMLYAFMAWRTQFSARARSFIRVFFEFRMLGLHLDRVGDIALSAPEDNLSGVQDLDVMKCKGKLEVKDVSFRYSDEEAYVLSNFNFLVLPGESIALIAPSGFGKTTALKIMSGLLPAGDGSVLIDGVDINAVGLEQYRGVCAAVMQDDHLLSGSIEENVTFFDDSIDEDGVIECLKMVNVYDEVFAMPMGVKTLMGDMGNAFSGGQVQRILIARALYRRPKVIFMDEATSNLDAHNESIINSILKELSITRIVVSHRTETILMADRIFDMTEGKDITKDYFILRAEQYRN